MPFHEIHVVFISVPVCYTCLRQLKGPPTVKYGLCIRFLNARSVLPSEIHHQICQVYGDNAMSDGMVRKWVRMFNEGRENVHDEARIGRPSLVNDDLVFKVNKRVHDNRRFTISDVPALSSDFKDPTL